MCNDLHLYYRAIQASLEIFQQSLDNSEEDGATTSPENVDPDLHMAIMLSEQQNKEEEQKRLEEQKMLEEILRLSLTEK